MSKSRALEVVASDRVDTLEHWVTTPLGSRAGHGVKWGTGRQLGAPKISGPAGDSGGRRGQDMAHRGGVRVLTHDPSLYSSGRRMWPKE